MNVLYDNSTGEIRVRAFDEAGSAIVNATVTCTLKDAHQRPATVFSGRAMPYSASHPYTDTTDLGCYFCTVSASELASPDGTWEAIVTIIDSLANQLVLHGYIEVQPFVPA